MLMAADLSLPRDNHALSAQYESMPKFRRIPAGPYRIHQGYAAARMVGPVAGNPDVLPTESPCTPGPYVINPPLCTTASIGRRTFSSSFPHTLAAGVLLEMNREHSNYREQRKHTMPTCYVPSHIRQ